MNKLLKISLKLTQTTVFLALISCNPIKTAPPPMPTDVVLIYDRSMSVDGFLNISQDQIESIFDQISQTGGGSLSLVYVLENSNFQDPVTMQIPYFHVDGPHGNKIQKRKQAEKNQKEVEEFNQRKKRLLSEFLSKLNLLKTGKFSDVIGALNLADQIHISNTGKKYIVIVSDMKHNVKRNWNLAPLKIADDVVIRCVRPGEGVEISKLIQGRFSIFGNISDAMRF